MTTTDQMALMQGGALPGRPLFAIVMPVLNAASYLPASIPAALEAAGQYGNANVILVDNGSTDDSLRIMRSFGDRVHVIQRPGVTISALRNLGVEESEADIVAFIDADCVIEPEHLVQSLSALESSGAAATGSQYALPEKPHWIETIWFRMHASSADGPVRHINGGNLVCRRSVFDSVGGFNERLTTGEDAELCLRLLRAGHLLYSSSAIVARHLGNPKSLSSFFRKQRWHALGSFGTWRLHGLDKPLLMTAAFAFMLVVALVALTVSQSTTALLAAALSVLAVPATAVIYRSIHAGVSPPLVRGTVLYMLYFTARVAGISAVLMNRHRYEESGTSSHNIRG